MDLKTHVVRSMVKSRGMDRTIEVLNWIQIRCCVARDPFDHFEIHANLNLKVLTRISKWSNRPRTAVHGAAQ
jgi:hypothetical protein